MLNRLIVLVALSCFMFCLTGFAQDAQAGGGFRGSMHFGLYPRNASTLTGQPYCGEVVTSHVQTLADGTHLTSEADTRKVCRDSMARTRNERQQGAPGSPPVIEITDPVAHVWYVLDTQAKVAHKMSMLAPERPAHAVRSQIPVGTFSAPAERPVSAGDPKEPKLVNEKLAPQTIEGVQAEGWRSTNTWPEGSRLGNDRPLSSVTESWSSPELGIPVLVKTSDPRSGERTEKLTNLIRSEPDPRLFQPPPDYTIVDEKEDFTITWGPRAR